MTAEEVCFLLAAAMFVVEALPSVKTSINLLPLGLALVAFGLALAAGFASRIGLDGAILRIGL